MGIIDDKLELLGLYFPEIDKSVLLDLLISCNESVEQTCALIKGTSSATQSKRKTGTLYQSSITSLLGPVSKKPRSLNKEETSGSLLTPASTSRVIRLYTPDQVKQHLSPYASFHKNFLPKELSDSLLNYLLTRTDALKAKEFYMFDSYCRSSHASGVFVSRHNVAHSDIYENLAYNGKCFGKLKYYDDNLQLSSNLIDKFINETIIPTTSPLPFQSKETWKSSACVINYYDNLSSHLDYHSDRLSHIGPHNFVVSLSLGSTREFRLRRTYGNNTQIYSIILPHNSLIVMHPGCQEEFKHSVNALKNPIQINPISNIKRFNLTFRFYPINFIRNLPKCKCDLSMTLRRSFRSVENRGKYFWSCENKYQNKDCGVFYWANLNNPKGNFIAPNDSDVSVWISDQDQEKWNWIYEQVK